MTSESEEAKQKDESGSHTNREQESDAGTKSKETSWLDCSFLQRESYLYSILKRRSPTPDDMWRYLKFAPSVFFGVLLLMFLVFYGPVVLEDPESITPSKETYSTVRTVGEGDQEGDVYQLDDSESGRAYREEFIAECTPEGDYLSTGSSFDCQYNVSYITYDGKSGLVKFEREFLDRISDEPLIIAEWERLSPEGETTYVTHRYGYSSEPTLNRTFEVFTPTEPGEYEFSLLISSYLNPVGPEHSEARVVYTSTSNVYVYSEEQAASFTISVATYRLEQVAVIGIAIGLFQLVRGTYPTRRD